MQLVVWLQVRLEVWCGCGWCGEKGGGGGGGGGGVVKPIYLSFALLWVVFFSSHVSGRLTCFN